MKSKLIREILKIYSEKKISHRDLAQTVGVSKGSVGNTLKRAKINNIEHYDAEKLSNEDLVLQLYPTKKANEDPIEEPDFKVLAEEMSQSEVTVQLLYEEYAEKYPEGLKRTAFFERIRIESNVGDIIPSMHQMPKGGRYLQMDYSGLRTSYFDREEQKNIVVELFVASWSASSYLYVEATPSQKKEDWIASNVRALRYFSCVPEYIIPDNLKSAVVKANFYDPKINRAYYEMAKYYGTAILPARALKPKDKAGVESNVKYVQQFILGRLRKRKFYSLKNLNDAIHEVLIQLNDRPMQRYKVSRKERFEKIDKPNASPITKDDYKILRINPNVKVGEDHHVHFDDHYYSVPWRLTRSRVDVWLLGKIIEVYHDGDRVASHAVSTEVGGYSTLDSHRPPNHLFVRKLKPLWVLSKAKDIGPQTHKMIADMISDDARHCEVAVRKGLGLIDLCRDFPASRVEKAVIKAMNFSRLQISDVKCLLEQGLDDDSDSGALNHENPNTCAHENIRGADHYKNINKQGE